MEAWGSPHLEAHVAYLRHLGSAPGAEVRESGDLFAVRTRVRSNSENAVVSGAGARVARATAEELAGWFEEWGVPASWLCAEGDRRAATVETLAAAGYAAERSAWEMQARIDALALDAGGTSAATRIEPVASAGALDGWLEVAGACGWFETGESRGAMRDLFAGLGLGGSAPLRHYVALRGASAVGMASAFFTREAVLLASVAVLPALRRQGIGRELALARLREARDRGCALALLAPSPDGAALYAALGFESRPRPPDRWFYAPLRRPVS